MMILTEQIIIDIIRREMEIPAAYAWVRDQARKIPQDDGLYVVAGMLDSYPMSATVPYLKEVEIQENPRLIEVREVNDVQLSQRIQVDVFSRSNAALQRSWEIIAALNSIYAKQMQEEYNFKINRLPTAFINTSFAEGSSQLFRYSLSFSCFVWYRKEKALSTRGKLFFDDFGTRVDDDNTIATDNPIFTLNFAAATAPKNVTYEGQIVTFNGEPVTISEA